MINENLLEIKSITKKFPGVLALDDVSFGVKSAEVHAICGENGAGKSTLMNILSGIYQPDGGEIMIGGQKVRIENHKKAQDLGISIVYQECSLANNLSVAENMFVGRQPRDKFGTVDWKRMNQECESYFELMELQGVSPEQKVGNLSAAYQQIVEILKAMTFDFKILILDEPTASIGEKETQLLFNLIRKIKAQGKSVVYISHRMAEIFEIADRVTVLKDGKYVDTRNISEIDVDDVIKMMVGRNIEDKRYASLRREEKLLQVRNLNSKKIKDISFDLYAGEILCLTGLVGSGRTETAMALFGNDPKAKGEIRINGELRKINSPKAAMKSGIGYISEDRKSLGLFLEMSVLKNMISAKLNMVKKNEKFTQSDERALAEDYKRRLSVATPSIDRKVAYLSGGNQQKVVLAKWLMLEPRILIMDEPTRGIDVGAKEEIYKIIREIAAEGVGVIMISSDMREVIRTSDRVLVFAEGRISGELVGDEIQEEAIMAYASGLDHVS